MPTTLNSDILTSVEKGSEAPKTEDALPARLFRNGVSPPKSEDAGNDACATLSIHLLAFPYPRLSCTETSGCLKFSDVTSLLII